LNRGISGRSLPMVNPALNKRSQKTAGNDIAGLARTAD
jgi:hypothetical protein